MQNKQKWERKDEQKTFQETVFAVNNHLKQLKHKNSQKQKIFSKKQLTKKCYDHDYGQKQQINSSFGPDSLKSSEQCYSKGSMDSDLQTKRRLVYATESFQQDPLNQSTIQMNNKLFQMVFLGKSDKYGDSISTNSSLIKFKNGFDITDFSIGKKLGVGKFGEVYFAKHKKSGFLCAIKRMQKNSIDNKMIVQLIRQIKIQSFLNHPNIIKLYGFFSDEKYIYLIEQLCYSGQLYSFLRRKRKLSQELVKNIIQQVCRALDYMHQCLIIHRDLKPENIIYHNGLVKICDFGWSISSQQLRKTFCGTPLYISPQLLEQKHYSNKVDVWSVGILTYELLFGRVPFDINQKKDFIKIVEDQIKFSKATSITDEAKDFINVCLAKNPQQRYTVLQLLTHKFLTRVQPCQTGDMY